MEKKEKGKVIGINKEWGNKETRNIGE